MLNLVNNSTKETFRLPQSVHEIGFDYVSSCVEHIELRKHYALIALKNLSMSIKRGTIFSKVGQSAAASVINSIETSSSTLPKLDTTIIQTVTCVDYKIIRITDIIGHNNNEGIPEKSSFNKFIIASNLLEV